MNHDHGKNGEPFDMEDFDAEGIDERFADWVDGRLNDEERSALEAELDGDPELRARATEYRATVMTLRSHLGTEEPPADLADAVMQQLPGVPKRRNVLPLIASVAAAIAMVMLPVLLQNMGNQPAPSETTAELNQADLEGPNLDLVTVNPGAADGLGAEEFSKSPPFLRHDSVQKQPQGLSGVPGDETKKVEAGVAEQEKSLAPKPGSATKKSVAEKAGGANSVGESAEGKPAVAMPARKPAAGKSAGKPAVGKSAGKPAVGRIEGGEAEQQETGQKKTAAKDKAAETRARRAPGGQRRVKSPMAPGSKSGAKSETDSRAKKAKKTKKRGGRGAGVAAPSKSRPRGLEKREKAVGGGSPKSDRIAADPAAPPPVRAEAANGATQDRASLLVRELLKSTKESEELRRIALLYLTKVSAVAPGARPETKSVGGAGGKSEVPPGAGPVPMRTPAESPSPEKQTPEKNSSPRSARGGRSGRRGARTPPARRPDVSPDASPDASRGAGRGAAANVADVTVLVLESPLLEGGMDAAVVGGLRSRGYRLAATDPKGAFERSEGATKSVALRKLTARLESPPVQKGKSDAGSVRFEAIAKPFEPRAGDQVFSVLGTRAEIQALFTDLREVVRERDSARAGFPAAGEISVDVRRGVLRAKTGSDEFYMGAGGRTRGRVDQKSPRAAQGRPAEELKPRKAAPKGQGKKDAGEVVGKRMRFLLVLRGPKPPAKKK